jgi:hypothetical protein
MTRDLRKYARQTNIRSLVGFLLLLFFVGDGLIYALYGKESAIMGLVCIAAGVFPLLMIWFLLWGMDLIVKKAREE